MAEKVARPRVEFNGKAIESQIEKLTQATKEWKKELMAAEKAGDKVSMDKLKKSIDGAEKEVKQLTKEVFKVDNVIKDINGTSFNNLKKAFTQQSKLVRGLRKDSAEYNAELAKQKLLGNAIKNFNGDLAKQQGIFKRAANGFNNYFGIITAGIAALSGIGLTINKAVDMANIREEVKDELGALTGLADGVVNELEQIAIKTATTTDEHGIKIKQSADDILNAYKLMGSAKPELLGNAEALSSVTKEALILAEASKMETAPAVEALANIMNQFNAGSEDAAKFVNILAAGSQAGAAEVGDLADAIIRSGAAANQANISIEEEVALIEALAEKGIKAEKAGTGLKTFLLKLQTGADDTNPAIVGMSKALENLEAKNLSAAQMTNMFGMESYTVASILINSRDKFDELTTAVTGTSIAYEQAAKNTSNNAAALAQAKNRSKEIAVELGKRLQPAMVALHVSGATLLKVLLGLIDFFGRYGKEVIIISALIAGYTLAINASIIADKVKLFWTNQLIGGLKKLWATIIANPYTALAAVVIMAILALNRYLDKVRLSADELAKLTEVQNLNSEALRENNALLDKAKNLIGDISKLKKGEILDNLKLLETEISIGRQMMLKASMDDKITTETYNKITDNFNELVGLRMKLGERLAELDKIEADERERLAEEEKAKRETNNKDRIDKEKALQDALLALRKQYGLVSQKELYDLELKELDNNLARKLLSADEYSKAKQAIYNKYLKADPIQEDEKDFEIEDPTKSVASLQAEAELDYQNQLYAQSMDYQYEILMQQWNRGEIGWTEYNDRLIALDDQLWEQKLVKAEEGFQDIGYASEIASNFVAELKNRDLQVVENNAEKELNIIDTNLKNGVISEEQAAAQKEALTEQTEATKKEIMKKYADAEFATKIAQIISSTALAIMQAYAQLGPIAGTVAAPIIAATGVVQLLSAKGERERVQSLEVGGYTDTDGANDEVAGIVHKNEFVANARATANPSVKGVLDIINLAQQNGTIRTLDLGAAIQNMNITRGFASGGYTSNTSASTSTSPSQSTATNNSQSFEKAAALIYEAAKIFASKNLIITADAIKKITEAGYEYDVKKASGKR